MIANPPFNDSDWSGDLLRKDVRWKYGVPPVGNANYAWIQHFVFHLAPCGRAGFVLAKGALTTKQKAEYEIKKNLIEADLIDCIVNLPSKLFLNTQIPASLWFIRKSKETRRGKILFIDARDMGKLINRRNRILTQEDIKIIATTYHLWQKGVLNDDLRFANGDLQDMNPENVNFEEWKNLLLNRQSKIDNLRYIDIKGFCKSATIEQVRELDYVLTPGRYVGLPNDEEDFDFEERFSKLKAEFLGQIKEEERLNELILENLEKIDISGEKEGAK